MTDSIAFSLGFEHFLSLLFGKRKYHSTTGILHTPAGWRKELLQIASAVRWAISANVRATDPTHRAQLLEKCSSVQEALKQANTINELNLVMIQHLTAVSFLLMGAFPDHWDASHFPGPRAWSLARFRHVNYSQTPEQKVGLMLELARHGSSKLYNEMMEELVRLRNKQIRLEDF